MELRQSLFILSIFGCLFLSSSALALQSGDFIYTESGNSITITDYAGSGGAVVLPDTIDGKTVTAIGFVAFFNCNDLTSLTIPVSVIRIEAQAFSGCTGLTSLIIPASVTSIGAEAFSFCSGLTRLAIPASVTSIGAEAFSNCAALTGIEVDAGNPAYSSLDGVLYNKARTVLMQYPGGKAGAFTIPGSVTSIKGYAFFACSGLTGVTIPAGVKSIGDYAFYGCTGLTTAYFYGNAPGMGTEVFKNCASGFGVCSLPGSSGFTNLWYGYPVLVPRFFDNLNGTVTDTVTSLIWLKNGNAEGIKSWTNAMSWGNNLAAGTAELTDGSLPGDWRLPNKAELSGLLSGKPGSTTAQAWLAANGFVDKNFLADYYWTSETYAPNNYYAYVVLFTTGLQNWAFKQHGYSVRAVRAGQFYTLDIAKAGSGRGTVTSSDTIFNCGSDCYSTYSRGIVVTLTATPAADGSKFGGWSSGGCTGTAACIVTMTDNLTVTANFTAPKKRFYDNGDGTVTDTNTGLVWLKNGNADGPKFWNAATTWCSSLVSGTAGLSDGSVAGDWRLPTKAELEGMISGWTGVSPGAWLAANGFADSNLAANWYWTSSAEGVVEPYRWLIGFQNGQENYANKNTNRYVRAVRNQ